MDEIKLFLLLLVPQLFDQFKGSRFVVCHIPVPFFTELSELHSLSVFNVEEFFFLRDPHVLLLSLLLGLAEFIKFSFHVHSSRVVIVLAGDDSLLVQ